MKQGRTLGHLARVAVVVAAVFVGLLARSAEPKQGGTDTVQSSRLYTPPDSAAGGGIRGRIAGPRGPASGVFALAVDDYRLVYRADLGDAGRSFSFRGLPVGRYDLVVLFGDGFVEGLTLTRDESTLTAADVESIGSAVRRGTPFFDTKALHRCEGVTGEAGKARAVLQEVRTRPVTLQSAAVRDDIQVRSLKLVLAENVGKLGWSVVNTREIVRQEVLSADARGLLPHVHDARLGGIRVLETMKDMGEVAL